MLKHVPKKVRDLYVIHDHRHAAAILASEFPAHLKELVDALTAFRFTREQIVEKGGSESAIPKTISALLRPNRWLEAKLNARLVIDDAAVSTDSHWIDHVKGRVAFDLEWNSKDQTFDRDLFAFRAFFDYDKISVGVLVTRGSELGKLFKSLKIQKKYGASTTHWDKLIPRIRAGRSGGCPVLALGITEALYVDG